MERSAEALELRSADLTTMALARRNMAMTEVARREPRPQPDSRKKQCKTCGGEKDLADFYAHPKASDGFDSSCKECRKEKVRANREAKADYYRAFDRKRYRDDPQRKAHCQATARSENGQRLRKQWEARSREREPEKWRARNAVNNALRDGKITREPCFFCGSENRLQAHHEDYSHPLDVVWLCAGCHGKLHTIKGDFRRA